MGINNRLKVKLNTAILFIYTFVMFWPAYFDNVIIKMLENGILVIAFIVLFRMRYRPSKIVLLVWIRFIYLLTISFVNRSPSADIHLFIVYLKVMVYISFLEAVLKLRGTDAVDKLYKVTILLVLLDFLSVVFFPDGLYRTETVWNEWSTSETKHWFFGNKNNRIYYYEFANILICIKCCSERTQKNKILLIITAVCTMVAMILTRSSTATVVSVVTCIAAYIGVSNRKNPARFLSIYFTSIAGAALTLMMLFGSMSFIQPITQAIFGKDASYTGRTVIWSTALSRIRQKPLFGWGYYDSSAAKNYFGNLSFSSAHNELLNTLWQGGIVLLAIIILFFIVLSRKIHIQYKRKQETILSLYVLAIMIDMMQESILSVPVTWAALVLCYEIAELNLFEKREKKVKMVSYEKR